MKKGKKYINNFEMIDRLKEYKLIDAIDILKNVMLSRMEREEKPRIDYMGLAIDIVNDLRERH